MFRLQSEQEKQIHKLFRKEEKRLAKKRDDTGDDEAGDWMKTFDFDPKQLRAQRSVTAYV